MHAKLRRTTGIAASILLSLALFPGTMLADNAANNSGTSRIQSQQPFGIRVVDSKTGRGIPAVELRTTNNMTFYTDSAGYVAFKEVGLMNETVFFHLSSDGYKVPQDMFGYYGQAVEVTPGGSVTLTMDRVNIAERLYRMTGEGIYRDSLLLGKTPPINEPLLNGKVMGQDSVQTIKYKNKLYWFWGDTDRVAYPLGNFRVTGATSKLPGQGGLDPDVGVDLSYFKQDDGFVKSLVPTLPDGANIAWVFGLMTAKDSSGQERLLAGYSTHNPDLSAFGILQFNDQTEQFEQLVQFPDKNDWRHPGGQASYYKENGKGYWVFTEHRMPNLRVPATYEAIKDYTKYEAFTPLEPGTTYNGVNTQLERDASGKLVWSWKQNTPPLKQDEEKELINLGVIKDTDARYYQLKDVDTGAGVTIAGSSVEWNDYRQKYVLFGQQMGGTSSGLGEMWYAEAPAPQGPWTTAKKIITHNNYTFYNPAHDEFFDKAGGRYIYLEATYTNSFTDHEPTPRYNYNQMMYKLDLANPDLGLTPPVTDLAKDKPIAAASNEKNQPAKLANDGSSETFWISAAKSPQWLKVDLGAPSSINRVVLNWGTAYGKAYQIQISNDGAKWKDVYNTKTGDGDVDDIAFADTKARYVRMYAIPRGAKLSVRDFEVYGSQQGSK
ncbi:discoidin domain-containing protein [Paenibacillus sp. JDR-2]|uniref:discoidin domain-containing protein n=1 Tax=Paenibacillus sp. (strain JDR-2) TaxID=324057 RepID=UPI0001663CFD|nr:discoidin domain-containing protein [Paenibacillus sp. JDR-2]ACT02818.1 coagulation factor 5/8 type domain protein [Paenibacillus sp. JDR-2]